MPFVPHADWLVPERPARARSLPAPFYTHPGSPSAERHCVFARSWQLVAQIGQLADSGDHVVAEIAGIPIIVVRGEDGELRALHNVCRHRAGPLATCNGRGARNLVCRYHGWTYHLDGRLRGAPEMSDAEDFSVDAVRLPEVNVAQWQGLVFVALGEAPPFNDVVAGINERLGERRLDKLAFRQHASYEIACNWKIYVDNFLEGYHLPIVHPGLNRLLDYRSYVTETHEWHSLQWSPLETAAESGNNFYGDGDALYYFIYPNTMLNILPGRLQTNRVIPLGVDRCRVDFDYYYPSDGDNVRHAQDVEFSDEVQHEDIAICEAVQRGMASGSWQTGRLNPKRETGLLHFHELLRRAYRDHGDKTENET
ncbi:MAG: Rieske 2Fe-2S domain-containing protein [Proteobacteria bacterium]|nr:Rieske 2Fe-2S domain-containing protein [Pseudomonadota bacterium]